MALEKYRGSRLDQIAGTTQRRPAWRVVIYNPRLTTVQDVARNLWSGVRLDVSNWASNVSIQQNQVFENSDDAVSSRSTITFEVDDTAGVMFGDFRVKIDQRLFRDGTPIQIFEGDRRIARQDWIPVFTGVIRGNPGSDVAERGRRRIRVQCFGRGQLYQRQDIVGINWDYGTDLGAMAVDVAMVEMALTREEIRFGTFDSITRHKSNALTQIGKMQGLNEIMQVVGRKPYFDSEGLLVSHDTSLFKPPTFTFRAMQIKSMQRVQQLAQFINSVEVIGLSDRMTKVTTPVKPLTEINTTVGYFDNHYSETIWFSNDKKRRAQNTFMEVLSGGGGFLGGGVTWTVTDEFSGVINIDTGYVPELLTLIASVWAGLSIAEYALDLIIGEFGIIGTVYSLGTLALIRFGVQIAKAATMIAYQYIMTRIGRYRMMIHGEPFEFVFQELRAIAALSGVTTADTVERKETMHWLTRIEDVKARAKELLRREQVKTQTYEITMPSVAALEVDDIIEVDTAGEFGFRHPARFYVISIQRTYQRGPEDALMVVRAWHCQDSPKALNPVSLANTAVDPGVVINPYDGFSNVYELVIDHTVVAANANADITDFVIRFVEPSGTTFRLNAFGGEVVFANLTDVSFALDAQNLQPIAHDKLGVHNVTGTLDAILRIPNLSRTEDTTIYLFVGKASQSSDVSDSENAWTGLVPTSIAKGGIWHLDEDETDGTLVDASLANRLLTVEASWNSTNIDRVAGPFVPIGTSGASAIQKKAQAATSGARSSQVLTGSFLSGPFTLGCDLKGTDVTGVFEPAPKATHTDSLYGFGNNPSPTGVGIFLRVEDTDESHGFQAGQLYIKLRDGNEATQLIPCGVNVLDWNSDGAWHKSRITWDGGTVRFYWDGELKGIGAVAAFGSSITFSRYMFGTDVDGDSSEVCEYDELWAGAEMSYDWIRTEWKNYQNPEVGVGNIWKSKTKIFG